MNKNPLVHAFSATAYIALIVLVVFYGSSIFEPIEDTILIPIAMLSLLVLSVAVMGYIFFYKPLQLYIDGNKQEAVSFFFKTLGYFAGITVIIFVILLFLSR